MECDVSQFRLPEREDQTRSITKSPPRLSYIYSSSTEIPNTTVEDLEHSKERANRANRKLAPMLPRCKAHFHPRRTVGSERRSATQDRGKLQSQVIISKKEESSNPIARAARPASACCMAMDGACVRKWRAHESRPWRLVVVVQVAG
jgi:hypothetical protein